jgi:hypothetical protein
MFWAARKILDVNGTSHGGKVCKRRSHQDLHVRYIPDPGTDGFSKRHGLIGLRFIFQFPAIIGVLSNIFEHPSLKYRQNRL